MSPMKKVYVNNVVNNDLLDNLRMFKEAKIKLNGLGKSKKYHFAYIAVTLDTKQ